MTVDQRRLFKPWQNIQAFVMPTWNRWRLKRLMPAIRSPSTFTWRLIIGIGLLDGLTIALVAWGLWESHSQLRDQAIVASNNMASVLDRHISSVIDQTDLVLADVATHFKHSRDGTQGQNGILEELARPLKHVAGIGVTRPDGKLTGWTGIGALADATMANHNVFSMLRETPGAELAISKPFQGTFPEGWQVVLARRLERSDATFGGIVFAIIPAEQISTMFAPLDVGPGGAVILRDNNSNLIARYPGIDYSESHRFPVSDRIRASIKAGVPLGTFRIEAGPDHDMRTVSFRRVGRHPLYIITAIADRDWLGQWRSTAIGLVAFATVFLSGSLVMFRIVRLSWRQANAAKARLQTVLDSSPAGLVVITSEGTVTMINDAAARILRIGENIAGRPAVAMLASADLLLDSYVRAYPLILDAGTFEDELLMRRLDGSEFWCRLSVRLVIGQTSSGEAAWVIEDVSEQHLAQEKLRASEERYRGIIECQSEFIIRLDLAGHFLFVNEAFARALRLEPEEILCTLWQTYVHADDIFATGKALASASQPPAHRATIENRLILPGGDRWVAWEGWGIPHPNGKVLEIQAIGRDITERKLAEEQVQYLAYHDALTGLPNQSLIEDRARMVMAYADRFGSKSALLFLDLDHFKVINDSIGAQVGDLLLKQIAGRLEQSVRDTDTVGRHSGDEFLILLADIYSSEAAISVADKIGEALAKPFDVGGHMISASASIGIAIYPEDGRTFETLLRLADAAMCEAKDMGRNTCCLFNPAMLTDVTDQLRLRHDLRQGLEQKEFVLHYQPQVNLATGNVIGVEALIRWNHPELGMVPPGQFIPVAESSGLIVTMGDWVIREACRQIAAWQRDGLPEIVVAVNLSALQFKRGNLEETVTSALDNAGVDPAWLELELTESILIKDAESILTTVGRLKSLGIKLSIDDFGTGYSSLAYLKRFKVDKLKIDQSFVRDLAMDDDDASIVRTIIQMAGNLNLKTIAEGVENEQTLRQLKSMNCDEVQGYYFARPMAADDFAEFASSFYWDHTAGSDAGGLGRHESLERI